MSKMPIEELTDILCSNNFGHMSVDPDKKSFFYSHRVIIGGTEDGWILYPISEATGGALRKLFFDSFDVEIGQVMTKVVAFEKVDL